MNNETKIESILFFRNEPVSFKELSSIVGVSVTEVKTVVESLTHFYSERGIVIVSDGESVTFGTHAQNTKIIENLTKEELSRELGRAGLETLAIILYRSPVSRREIDHIRGVNSGFILRNLLIRGLIERTEALAGERSYTYKPTLKLLEHLGVSRKEDLPEFNTAFKKIEEFVENSPAEEDNA